MRFNILTAAMLFVLYGPTMRPECFRRIDFW
jgi:hypothetical protein